MAITQHEFFSVALAGGDLRFLWWSTISSARIPRVSDILPCSIVSHLGESYFRVQSNIRELDFGQNGIDELVAVGAADPVTFAE